ncbi:hypothetical protein [Streptosporangium jomthongense]|uniref:Uncharacterized protein n=1 Tax=Streptosporangium jomthongense TaxID=1193683 RepID=A0ABV8F862_9ACTN
MSTSTGVGRVTPGAGGEGAAWVSEHGAHLLDYAASHLASGRALPAVASVLTACLAEPSPPERVGVRGRLFSALRRDCLASPDHREIYVPDTGPGMPDEEVTERVWSLVEPLGTETLRLMYRHGLTTEDLAHVLAMPVEEVTRLATRTQDLLEILASGLDALANHRRTCPELGPLVERIFPEEEWTAADIDAEARGDLISHMLKCPVCARPINIRYTVPQMVSHPRIRSLPPQVRRQLLDALPEPPPSPPKPPARRSPGIAGAGPLAAPTAVAETGTEPVSGPPAAVDPRTRPARQDRSTMPYRTVRPEGVSRTGPKQSPDRRDRPAPETETDRRSRRDRSMPYGPASGDRSPTSSRPPKSSETPRSPERHGDRPTLPSLPVLPAPGPSVPPGPSGPPLAPPVPGQNTPLYDALFTQAWARNTAERETDASATMPSLPAVAKSSQKSSQKSPQKPAPKPATGREPDDTEGYPLGVRVLEALAPLGTWLRNTTVKVVIVIVAGATGTLLGMNLLAPVMGSRDTVTSLRTTTQSQTPDRPTASPQLTFPGAESSGSASGEPGGSGELAKRVRVPPLVTLDEFGQGNILLTVTGSPLRWRVTAPGLTVRPSSGTTRPGRPDVIALRAHRIRHWCGTPFTATTSLTVHGPDDSITTTVRWQTC